MTESPVDVVYTWVDGTDPLWMAERKFYWSKNENNYNKLGLFPEPTGDSVASSSTVELYYSIQTVKKYMPWIRKIYVISPNQRPKDIKEFKDVIFINQDDILPPETILPTFNSNVVELALHHIEGLSEHFIYFNDDFFVNRPCKLSDFYLHKKVSIFIENFGGVLKLTPDFFIKTYLHRGVTTIQRSYTNQILNKKFGSSRRYLLQHSPVFIVKEYYEEMINYFSDAVIKTLLHQFRHPEDLVTPHFLYPYFLLHTERGFINNEISGIFIPILSSILLNRLCFNMINEKYHFFALNDTRRVVCKKSIQQMERFLNKNLLER